MMSKLSSLVVAVALLGLGPLGCGDDGGLSREELMNPETCRDCHPKHVEEWESSMHAYAGDDPIFLAMNRRGQRETNGELGDFCIQCHAPMALVEGATTDGLNLEELPQHLKGITCYFCHTVDAVEGTHNNPLRLAGDRIMRAGISDPTPNGAHPTAFSSLHDRNNASSSDMCGSCHDIEINSLHLEQTFAEWKGSVFVDEPFTLTCSQCHMPGEDDVVADFDGVPLRRRHSHSWPGVDTALIDWPGKAEQEQLIVEELRTSVATKLCYNPDGNKLELNLTNIAAGHMFPSGATQDRRVWAEIVATVGQNQVLSSGVIDDQEDVDAVEDPLLWRLHTVGKDAGGDVTHMFWDMSSNEGELLPPAVTFNVADPAYDHSLTRDYPLGGNPRPDRVEAVVKIRQIALSVIDDLIESGDLDPVYRDRIKTFDLEGSRIVWTPELAGSDLCVP